MAQQVGVNQSVLEQDQKNRFARALHGGSLPVYLLIFAESRQ